MLRRMTSSPRRSTRNRVSSFGSKSVRTAAAPQSRTASRSCEIAIPLSGHRMRCSRQSHSLGDGSGQLPTPEDNHIGRPPSGIQSPHPRPRHTRCPSGPRGTRVRGTRTVRYSLPRNPITGIDAAARIRPAERRDRFGDRALGHELPSCRLTGKVTGPVSPDCAARSGLQYAYRLLHRKARNRAVPLSCHPSHRRFPARTQRRASGSRLSGDHDDPQSI